MSIEAAEQLEGVKAALMDWVQQDAGLVQIASNPAMMWEMAYAASSKLRIILCCVGEELRGDFSVAAALHRADRQFVCLVTRGRSFTTDRGMGLTQIVQDNPPLFTLVEKVRDTIRAMIGISVELPVDYKGFRSFPLEDGLIMDAYQIEFSTAVDLPALVTTPPDPAIPNYP